MYLEILLTIIVLFDLFVMIVYIIGLFREYKKQKMMDEQQKMLNAVLEKLFHESIAEYNKTIKPKKNKGKK